MADFARAGCGLTWRGPAQILKSRGPRTCHSHLVFSYSLPFHSFPFVFMPLLFQSDTLGESPSARSFSFSKVAHTCSRIISPFSLFFSLPLLMLHFSLSIHTSYDRSFTISHGMASNASSLSAFFDPSPTFISDSLSYCPGLARMRSRCSKNLFIRHYTIPYS